MNFREAQARLLATLQDRIRNGDLTERGLARLTGISQPHVHNVLKGVRTLTPDIVDLMLKMLHFSLLDLSSKQELEAHLEWRARPHPMFEVRCLESAIGPKMPWPEAAWSRERYPVPVRGEGPLEDLVAARLMPDEQMRTLLEDSDVAALDVSERARTQIVPEGVYAVDRECEVILRYLRYGRVCVYALSEGSMSKPSHWLPVPLPEIGIRGVVRAKVIWVGREKNRHLPAHQRGRFLADATSW